MVKGQWTLGEHTNFSEDCQVVILFGRKGMNWEVNVFIGPMGQKVKVQWTFTKMWVVRNDVLWQFLVIGWEVGGVPVDCTAVKLL